MNHRSKNIIAALALALFATGAKAGTPSDSIPRPGSQPETSRPVTSTYSFEIGSKDVLATYLSPLHYTGADYAVAGSWCKAMPFSPQSAVMHFDAGIDFSNLWNPAETARMIGLNAWFNWGMSWRHRFPNHIQFTAGATVGIDGGAYYLLRNGNNPVEAIGNVSLAARFSGSRPFKIGKLAFLLSDQLSIPSFSVFFSPEYGETYYEIYLGNRKGLVHPGWWGNNFRIDNLLSATIDFGRTALTLGYRLKAYNQWANHLNTKIVTHAFVIGIVPGGIGLKKRTPKAPCETVYPLF